MAVNVKLDLSKLKIEFVYDSNFIKSQEDINTELGYSELTDSIMEQIKIIEESYIDSSQNKNNN